MHLLLPQLLFEQKLTLLMIFVYDFLSLCPIIHVVSHNCNWYVYKHVCGFLDNQLTVI